MAATRLIALHKNKGKSVAACLKSRTDYVQNPDKTEHGELISSYECSPLTVDEEFMLSKRQYELVTGRRQKSDVIAYQIRQSFKPGEITAEEANKVGYELAMRFTKGKYAFIVATHTDRKHPQPCDFQLHSVGWHQKVPGFFLFGVGSAAVERPDLLTGINLRKFSRRLASLFYTANAN